MAKIAFSKVSKIKTLPSIEVLIEGQKVEVEQYLPLEKKIELIASIISQSGNGEEGFFNIVKLETYYIIEMLRAYTNITFTEKQLEDTPKLYDIIHLNGIWEAVANVLPETEKDYMWNSILALAREITTYNNSILGVLKAISTNRDNLNFDIEEIMKNLNDPEALSLLKAMLQKDGLIN